MKGLFCKKHRKEDHVLFCEKHWCYYAECEEKCFKCDLLSPKEEKFTCKNGHLYDKDGNESCCNPQEETVLPEEIDDSEDWGVKTNYMRITINAIIKYLAERDNKKK